MTPERLLAGLVLVLWLTISFAIVWPESPLQAATVVDRDRQIGDKISWQTTSAGATRATALHFISIGTAGQVAVGAGSSSHFAVQQGYWQDFENDACACGDADGNAIITISDAVFLINYIFAGGPAPNPTCRGDADGNGIITISDAVYLINYIFAGGPAPQCQ